MKKRDKFEEVQKQYGADNPAKSSPDIKKVSAEKKPKRKEDRKMRRARRRGRFFVILQGFLSLAFVMILSTLGVLPVKYFMLVLGVVAILLGITYVTQKKKKAVAVLGKLFSFFVIVLLLVAGSMVCTLNYMLDTITGAPYKEEVKEVTAPIDLMGSTQFFSVAEDCFSVYIRDAQEDIDGNSASKVNMLATIHPETKQMLLTTIPKEYYVTIPDVSNGQKEKLSEAGTFGVEASMKALGNLYETEISYYLKADFEWLKEKKEMVKGQISVDMVKDLCYSVISVSDHVRTNLTKYEVQELVKKQILEGGRFNRVSKVATGTVTSNYTYTMPDTESFVMTPDQDSVKEIIDSINRVEDGEILKNTIQLK